MHRYNTEYLNRNRLYIISHYLFIFVLCSKRETNFEMLLSATIDCLTK